MRRETQPILETNKLDTGKPALLERGWLMKSQICRGRESRGSLRSSWKNVGWFSKMADKLLSEVLTTKVTAVASTAFRTDFEVLSPDRRDTFPRKYRKGARRRKTSCEPSRPVAAATATRWRAILAASWTTCWTVSSPRRTPKRQWVHMMAAVDSKTCERRVSGGGGADPDAPRSSSSPSSDSRTCPDRKSRGGK